MEAVVAALARHQRSYQHVIHEDKDKAENNTDEANAPTSFFVWLLKSPEKNPVGLSGTQRSAPTTPRVWVFAAFPLIFP